MFGVERRGWAVLSCLLESWHVAGQAEAFATRFFERESESERLYLLNLL